jgi:transposase InsO family protein
MSLAISPGCGRLYGIQRVCLAWGFPRSTLYDQKAREEDGRERQRPGPKPKVSDEALLGFVKEDLANSPFTGEGHRKVYRRLKGKLTAGRDRVLRVMRESQLLSPHRTAQGVPLLHQGTIITERPNEMWGTDGARVETVEEGWVWGFFALDHYNSECVGWHVAKVGDRFAALQPLAMGILEHFGSVESGIAAGLAIRADHGTQYTSQDFTDQVKAWGGHMSYAYVAEPQTNGISERFIRTLKEQVIHGKIYRNVEELRQAVGDFVKKYNSQWLLERLHYVAPRDARRHYYESAGLPRAA